MPQCDETRPNCSRCTKSNRVCPGYAEGLDLVLRSQNEVAKAGVGRRQKAAQKARDEASDIRGRTSASDSSSNVSSAASTSSEESLTLSPSYLAPSEDDYQLCLFIHTWVLYPHDVQADRGFVELLPFLYASVKLDSPLALCVAAISSALSMKFVLKMRNVETPKVQQKYAKALSATRRALQDPVESLADETLMAVCLLGFYEGAVESFRGRISSPRHFDGAAALIRHRQGRSTTEISQRLLLGVRNSILSRAVFHSLPVDESSAVWQDSGSIPHNPATLLDQMSMGIPNLLVAAKKTPSSSPEVDSEEKEFNITHRSQILTKAAAMEATLCNWPEVVPLEWNPVRVPSKDVPSSILKTGNIYQDHCDLYYDITVCSIWNSWRLARLKVLAITARLSPPSSPAQHAAISTIQSLADDICASVPFCMGSKESPIPLHCLEIEYPTLDGGPAPEYHHRSAASFGGWLLFSPMKEVMNVGMWLRPGQLAWMGTQLQRLAMVYDVEPVEDEGDRVAGDEVRTDLVRYNSSVPG